MSRFERKALGVCKDKETAIIRAADLVARHGGGVLVCRLAWGISVRRYHHSGVWLEEIGGVVVQMSQSEINEARCLIAGRLA